MRNGRLISTLLGFTVLLGLASLPAVAQNDSAIVQAAKQKASTKKARHVYTNEDYPESPEAAPRDLPAGVSDKKGGALRDAEAKPDSAATSDANDNTKSEDGKPEDAKADPNAKQKSKLEELQAKLAESKHSEEVLQKNLNDLQEKASNEQSEFRRNMYLDMVSNQQVTLSDFRRQQEQLQQQIDAEKSKNSKSE
ncbi:MAG: hypothetical protein ACM3JB_11250 [Acidobacteriaceae bacterium]